MSIKPLPLFAFSFIFFVFAGSGIVVLLQATHNTLPARSTALHIGRRQPKAAVGSSSTTKISCLVVTPFSIQSIIAFGMGFVALVSFILL